jgi:hypothetical protein
MLDHWRKNGCDNMEITRRLIDLFFVSVLLDAGAGDQWRYVEPGTEREYERSEGIAVASLYMFKDLAFCSKKEDGSPIVDGKCAIASTLYPTTNLNGVGKGLSDLTTKALATGVQFSDSNHMLGLESRADLLRKLGKSLLAQSKVFGEEGRPGNIVGSYVCPKSPRKLTSSTDYMKATAKDGKVDIAVFWNILQTLLIPVWPQDRTVVNGQAIGDAWPLSTLKQQNTTSDQSNSSNIQPFHKLTQWLAYSLMVPFQRILGLEWTGTASLTALPEYRNGGLFVDMGVLSLKHESLSKGLKASGHDLPMFKAGDDVVVEWRAMTLVLVDKLYKIVLERMDGVHLSMAQLLEAGTWKSGREVAAKKRPESKSSPIIIESDGTVF